MIHTDTIVENDLILGCMESHWKTPYLKAKMHFIGEHTNNTPSAKKTFEEKVGIDFADTIVVREPVEKGTEIIEKPIKELSAKKTSKEKFGIDFADTIVVRKWEKGLKHNDLFKIIEKPIKELSAKKTSKEKIQEDPIKILKIRLAKGEITKEEFEELRKLLDS